MERNENTGFKNRGTGNNHQVYTGTIGKSGGDIMDIIIKTWNWWGGQKKEIIPLRFTTQGYIRRKDQERLLEALEEYAGRRVKVEVR